MYKVFVRNWWKPNAAWSTGREPDSRARKTTLATVATEAEARQIAQQYNATHDPGKLSRKAKQDIVLSIIVILGFIGFIIWYVHQLALVNGG